MNPWLQVLEDPGHALTVTEVLARQDPKDWRVENNQGRFGFSGASVWLSLRLAPDPDVNGDYLLHLRTPNLSYAALYLLVDGKLRWSAELPEDTPLHARPFRHRQFVFPLQFKPDEQPRLLVKVTPRKNLAMTVPVDLWQTEPFRAADQGQMLFYGVLYGVTSIMALYALVLFFAIRENSHLHFAAFLFSNTLFQANFQGVLTQFCWPERGASLEMALNGTITPFVMATSLGFFAEFSKVGRWFPTTGRLTRYFVYINLGLGSFAPLIGYNTALNASLVGTMLMGWVSFPIAIAAWKHGGRAGRAFVSCLPIFSVGGIALTLRGLGLLPGGFWSEDYQPTSTIAMVLILAFALSDRINQERAERERAQERALEVEKEAAATLQHKVDERTSELANQTRAAQTARAEVEDLNDRLCASMEELGTLFDGLRQGVFSFRQDLRIGDHWSAEAGRIFKREELEGLRVDDLLLRGIPEWHPEHESLQRWLALVFETPPERFEELAELAPSEFVFRPDTPEAMQVQLEFCAITHGGALLQVLCLATDVSAQRRAEIREAQSQEDLQLLRGLTDGGADMVAFLRVSQERWNSFRELLEGCAPGPSPGQVQELFRLAHTIKGEARLHGASEIEESAALVEHKLQSVRGAPAAPTSNRGLMDELRALRDSAQADVELLRSRLVELSPVGEAIFDRTTVSHALLRKLLASANEQSIETRQMLEKLAAQPFGDSASRLGDAASTWAAERGKQVVVQLEGVAVPVPGKLNTVLRGALTHLIRNAVVHGIEPPELRSVGGKNAAGMILMRCEPCGDGVQIQVSDDGGGIDLTKLTSAARDRGLTWREGNEQELIFHDGLSTVAESDDLAGRGVGMPAARSDLRSAGYQLDVRCEQGKGTSFLITPLDPGLGARADQVA